MEAASDSHETENRYDDSPCRLFAFATLLWGLIATAGGIFSLCLRLSPELFPGMHELAYGRLQPMYPNLAIFGFAANAIFVGIYYSTQRLCKTPMWSSMLSQLHFWCWQGIVFAMLWTLGHGVHQPRELAEAEWPIDVGLSVVWIVFFTLNLVMTIANRREPRIYISLWFYLASALSFGVIYVVGNLASPESSWTSVGLLSGVPDAMVQAWYRHHLSGCLLILPALGAMYYLLPKITRSPVYSYRLAVIQFWGFVLFYGWAAMRSLHYAPIPDLAGSLAVVFTLLLWMPQWGGVLNGWQTLRHGQSKINEEPSLLFLATGVICFAILTLEDTFVGLREVAALTQYSDWNAAHREILVYGFNGMVALGGIYWILPRILRSPLWSPGAAKIHFGLSVIGLILLAAPLYVAGFLQGQQWLGLDSSGQLAHPEFVDGLTLVKPMWFASLFGFGAFAIGLLLQLINFCMTWLAPASSMASEPSVTPTESGSEPYRSKLEDAPVLGLAVELDRMSTFQWHGQWERNPTRLCLAVLVCLSGSSLLILGPSLLFAGTTTDGAQPYTPLELAGRNIYIREGCYNCHSQTVRPLVAETKRYGDYSTSDEFASDQPILWGSQRIGPDLAREGGRKPSYWHWKHLDNPRFEEEASVMPAFSHLLHERIDLGQLAEQAVLAAGTETPTESQIDRAQQSAQAQAEQITAEIIGLGGPVMRGDLMTYDTQVIALIAYLQRLGVDAPAPAKEAN